MFGSNSDITSSNNFCDICGAGVVQWCVDVCNRHLQNQDICYLVCKLHCVFSCCGIDIIEDFCTHVIQIIVEFIDDNRVATCASEAIVQLGNQGSQAREWLLGAGAAAASMNMLQKEVTCVDECVQICNLVQFMAAETSSNVLISEAGACEKVAVIFETHTNSPLVVTSACRAIVCLVENDAENEIRFEIFEICKLLMSTFRKYLNGLTPNLSVCDEICSAIETMTSDSEANLRKFSLDSALMGLLAQFLSKRFAENGDCTSCCRAVAMLAVDVKNSELFRKAGICETLTILLSKKRHLERYSYYILTAIHALCMTSMENVELLATKKLCDSIVAILQENSSQIRIDDHLTLIAMKVLCFVASVPDMRLLLGESGACRLLGVYVDAVNPKCRESTDIYKFTLLAVSTLCNSPPNQTDFGGNGMCEKICDAVKRYVDEAELLSAALSAVCNICDENSENVKLLCNANVISLLTDCLTTHVENALINELAARVVLRMSASSESGVVSVILINSPVCALLSNGLKLHLRARNVNRVICASIQKIAMLSPELKLQLSSDEVCPVLCQAVALGLSVSDDELLSEAISACTAVVSDSCTNQEAMGAAGLCELLADVCNEKVDNDFVIEKLLSCVANLCRCGADPITASIKNMGRFAGTNFSDNVVNILRNNISSLEVTRLAFITVQNMSANEHNLTRIVGIGGCEAVCITLKRLLHNERVCEAACGAISVLSTTDSYRKLVTLGAIDLITLTLQRYPDNISIVHDSSTGVINLCRDYDNKRQFAQKGVCGIISRALLKLGHHATIAEEASIAIWNLSANCPENKILLGAAGACEALVTTLKAHPGNLVVGKAITGALNSLIEGNGTNAKRVADAGGEKLRVSSLSTVEWRTAPGEAVTE